MNFDNFARNLNQALLRINQNANIQANYAHDLNESEANWERCRKTAKLWDDCIDLEIEIEDIIYDRERAKVAA